MDFAVLNAGRDKAHGHIGVRRAVSVVFARDGEVERKTVKGFAVDLNGVVGDHIDD